MIDSRIPLHLFVSFFLAACATDRVVLLPSPEGRQTAVVLHDRNGAVVFDRPYASIVSVAGAQGMTFVASTEHVADRFGAALAAQPPYPVNYTFYFEPGERVLTQESRRQFERVKREILERVASEVTLIGYTDRVGSEQSNDELSRRRAESVRDLLLEAGIPPGKIEVVGRGERDPVVPTADEVDEPLNRRVEINLR